MPLPDLLPNNTIRAWLTYTCGGIEHDMGLRFAAGTTSLTITSVCGTIAQALKAYITTGDSFSGVRVAAAGSNLSFPVAFVPVAGTTSLTMNDELRSKFVSMVGRSAGGYRCRVTFFSPIWGTASDFRGPTSGASANGALYQVIVGIDPDLVAIDGLAVVWNGYTNQGFNSYWQRQFR